jgi:hypothetical protein
MNSEPNSIMTSRWLRSFLVLVFVVFGQVYPYHHLHHSHDDSYFEFEISSHPIEVDVEHSSDHHHDGDAPHPENHQHAYDKHIDWHVVRTQNQTTSAFDDQFPRSPLAYILADDNDISWTDSRDPLPVDGNYFPSTTVRGPPNLG